MPNLRLTSPATQALTILEPTPNTTSFTVSTRPVPHTLPALVLHYVSLFLRLLIGACAVIILWSKWRVHVGKESDIALLSWVVGERGVEILLRSVPNMQWRFVGPSVVLVLGWVVRRGYKEESLLVLRGLGVQTSTSSYTYLRPPVTRFIPTTSIQDIFIHEAFKGFEVRFYLAIVVQGEEDVVVVFPHLLPRRHILEDVWRGAKRCLYEQESRGKS